MNQAKPPITVLDAVTQDISKNTGIGVNQLKIQENEAKTWSDGCLGLAKPDEFCTQALVEGWRIVVSDGSKNWVYRTDGTGQNIRLES
ncbi:S-layer protein [Aphanothece sacrum FPU1]|uniref:S-layer protein n=2 Tax=Aphanothece sacrum TaxID=1122 RepID=A0A401ICK3_APHSA|nr:S-layer protein [Aphanothece sacrum FPU1]GBF86681.1 S-layer protein [Aphanothece sacrum FPU3]